MVATIIRAASRCILPAVALRGGMVYGETDDFGYNIVNDPVHVHDLNATILHCLGIDHRRLSAKHLGLDMRLTGVEEHAPVTAFSAKRGVTISIHERGVRWIADRQSI